MLFQEHLTFVYWIVWTNISRHTHSHLEVIHALEELHGAGLDVGEVDGHVVGRDAALSAQVGPDRGRVAADTLKDIRHLPIG